MTSQEAIQKMTEVIRRKHLALNTEHSYCGWLKRYCQYIAALSPRLTTSIDQRTKAGTLPDALAKDSISTSTQNQAFNAILFFYKVILGTELKGVTAL